MAGAGYKNFAPGEVLTSSDVDNYLMEQSVMVFAGTAARGTTLTSPAEGMFSYRTDADALEVYTGTAWVPAAQAAGAATVTNRNLLYNGAMQVSQRGTSTTGITATSYYTADRYRASVTTMGTWTQTVESDAPTGSGLRNSLKMLCTTADASPAAGDLLIFGQSLEGQDLQRIRKGTSSAQKLTLSFWVKSNVTGTYVAYLLDADNTRQVGAQYTISASETWEKKTITFPADTTGAFTNDNGESLLVRWWLGAGSNFTSGTLRTTWTSSTNADLAVGQTNLAAAINNYWQVTGAQLEIGDVATDFEFKSYGQELAECQRYYYRHVEGNNLPIANGFNYSATLAIGVLHFPVTMRIAPTIVATTGTNYYDFARNGGLDAVNSLTLDSASTSTFSFSNSTEISGTAGHAGFWLTRNAASSVAFNAEL